MRLDRQWAVWRSVVTFLGLVMAIWGLGGAPAIADRGRDRATRHDPVPARPVAGPVLPGSVVPPSQYGPTMGLPGGQLPMPPGRPPMNLTLGASASIFSWIEATERQFVRVKEGRFAAPNATAGLQIAIDAAGLSLTPAPKPGKSRYPTVEELRSLDRRLRRDGRGRGPGDAAARETPAWRLDLRPERVGRAARMSAVAAGIAQADAARVTIDRGAWVEWYVNDERGLEQGLTFRERPAGDAGAPLVVEERLGGTMTARLETTAPIRGSTIVLMDRRGGEVLRCHDLRATDAAGRDLPAAFAIRKNVLVIRVDDREAAYPVTIDPIFTGSTVINGARFSNFGYTVAGAGDVNHDGFADVVVGSPFYQRDGYQVGRAYLFKGSADGLVLPAAWVKEPPPDYNDTAYYGFAVTGVGDVNGDGYDDVAVGAPDYVISTNPDRNDGGRAFLYRGSHDGLETDAAWTADSEDIRTDFGFSIEPAGDVNGDGKADVLVGDYLWGFDNGRPGRVYLFTGTGDGLTASPAWFDQGSGDFEFYGYGLAGLGDVNGDHHDDVAVSGYGTSGGVFYGGRVSIYYGGGGLGGPAWTKRGTFPQQGFGRQIAAAHDVNGDGRADMLVSSADGYKGVVSLFCGSSGGVSKTPCWSITGPEGSGAFGVNLAGPGDVSGDGYDDILFNDASGNAVLVVEGAKDFPLSGPTESLTGPAGGAAHGFRGAGDVNGDGGLDVVTGSPNVFNGNLNEGQVILWLGTKPHLQFIDPACIEDTVCNGDYLVQGSGGGFGLNASPSDFHLLLEAHVRRIGTTTDGVSQLLLRRISTGSVTFTLKKPDDTVAGPEWGVLKKRDGTEPGPEVTVDAEQPPSGSRSYAFAVYQPPSDFPGTINDVATGVTLVVEVSKAGEVLERGTIELIPPPFVLVHGVWSGPDIWQSPDGGLLGYLAGIGFPNCGAACLADYHDEPAASFDPLPNSALDSLSYGRLRLATNLTLRNERANGFADAQVDVVGHSEGGLVARAWAATQVFPFRWAANYGAGYFHKLITIGSPHLGTPMATFFLNHRCDESVVGPMERPLTLEELLAAGGRRIGPAVVGFQEESTMIEHLGRTDVPTHPIIGIEPVPQPTFGTESNLNALLFLIASPKRVDTILGFDGGHDTIVPELSQQGNIGVVPSRQYGVVHADVTIRYPDQTETNNSMIWQEVARLLLEPVETIRGVFAHVPSFFRPRVTDPLGDVPCPAAALPQPRSAAGTSVLTPPPGTVVHPGDTVTLVFTVTGGDAVDGAVFFIDRGFEVQNGPGPFALDYTIPLNRAGRIDISADTFGAGHQNYAAATWLQIDTASEPQSLQVFPADLEFTLAGESAPLHVDGHLAGGTTIDLTSSTAGTSYAVESGTAQVVTVSAAGIVTAVASGVDAIVVTHGSLTARVPVTVRITNRAPIVQVQAQVGLDAGMATDVTVTASDPDGQPLTLSASGLPSFATFTDAGDGTGTIHLEPSPTDIGTFQLYIAAQDNGVPRLGGGAPVTVVVSPCTAPTPGVTPTLTMPNSGQVTWTAIAGARGYDMVAGYLSLLRDSGGDFSQATIGCVLNDTPETSWTFFGAPPVGNGYWFLVRDVFCGGNGTFDSLGAGQVAPRDPGIDASGRGCP